MAINILHIKNKYSSIKIVFSFRYLSIYVGQKRRGQIVWKALAARINKIYFPQAGYS